MYYTFWGIIVLMTFAATMPMLWALRNRQSVPTYAKVMVLLLIPVLAGVLYWGLGGSQRLLHYWQAENQAKAVKVELAKIKRPEQIVDKLKSFLAKNPNNPQGWYLLGNLYYKERDFKAAVMALDKAYQQVPKNIAYTVAFSKADFFFHHRHLRPATKKMLLSVVRRDKNNIGALNLLAINDYLQKNYRTAIVYWERLLPLFSAGSNDQKALLSMIASAQLKAGASKKLKPIKTHGTKSHGFLFPV